MARNPRRGGGRPQQPAKGFRPGKEPPQIRKQQAKAQLGEVGWAQRKLIDVIAEGTPAEARAMMRRWRATVLTAAIVLAVAGAVLYLWSLPAGVVVHVLAAAAFAFWVRLRMQRAHLESLVDIVSGKRR